MNDTMYVAGQSWIDFTDELLRRLRGGNVVLWIGFSRTITLLSQIDGQPTRIRQAAHAEHLGDGLPLVIEPPVVATACGFTDGTGYRSTRPLLVAVTQTPEELSIQAEKAWAHGRQLVRKGFDPYILPKGHPTRPCGGLVCLQTGRTTSRQRHSSADGR